MNARRQLCTCSLDGVLFGLDVHDVQEVVQLKSLTPVPTARAFVAGVINLRGQIITVIDLRVVLEFPPRTPFEYDVHMVVRVCGEVVSFLVDEVGEVLEVAETDFEPPPRTLRGAVAELIHGAFKLPRQLLLVLDARKLVDRVTAGKHV